MAISEGAKAVSTEFLFWDQFSLSRFKQQMWCFFPAKLLQVPLWCLPNELWPRVWNQWNHIWKWMYDVWCYQVSFTLFDFKILKYFVLNKANFCHATKSLLLFNVIFLFIFIKGHQKQKSKSWSWAHVESDISRLSQSSTWHPFMYNLNIVAEYVKFHSFSRKHFIFECLYTVLLKLLFLVTSVRINMGWNLGLSND